MARRIVVTGASRGLGLEMVTQWLSKGAEVAALARRPEASAGLTALREQNPDRLLVATCDVADDATVEAACAEVAARWDGLDVLMNNAGIVGDRGAFAALDFADMAKVFDTNVVGQLRVTRALLPLLLRGHDPKAVFVTSKMGSIDDNSSGGAWAYRISKTGLNMAVRNLMFELDGSPVTALAIHPGWVQTDMGGSAAPLTIPAAVGDILATVEALRPEQSGAFLDRDGTPLPW